MKTLLLLGLALSAPAFAAQSWDCALDYSTYSAFKLQVDGDKVTGTYLGEDGQWRSIDSSSSQYAHTGASLSKKNNGTYSFSYGYAGWDGDVVTFDLREGSGTADANYWRDCVGDFHKDVSVTCSVRQ